LVTQPDVTAARKRTSESVDVEERKWTEAAVYRLVALFPIVSSRVMRIIRGHSKPATAMQLSIRTKLAALFGIAALL
jgi:hypothetical protein